MDELFRLGPVDPHLKSQFFLRREPVFVVPPALVTSRRILLIRSPRHSVVRLQQTLREVGKQHAFARRRRLRSHHYWSAVSPRFRSCISDLPFPLPRRALALLFPVVPVTRSVVIALGKFRVPRIGGINVFKSSTPLCPPVPSTNSPFNTDPVPTFVARSRAPRVRASSIRVSRCSISPSSMIGFRARFPSDRSPASTTGSHYSVSVSCSPTISVNSCSVAHFVSS